MDVLEPFSLTYVVYPVASGAGKLLALVSLTPIFAVVSYVTLLVSRRDCATAWLVLGTLLNEGLNYALKHAVRQPRPNGLHTHSPKYGWPSNHAQFVAFAAVYLGLWATGGRWAAPPLLRRVVVLGLGGLASLVCASRVVLLYHSWAQVGAGVGVGALAGWAWYAVGERVARPRYAHIAASPLGRALMLRDCTHVDVMTAEYEAVARTHGKGA